MSSLQILQKPISMLDGLYSLNDLHKASGGLEKHATYRFMRHSQTKELITEIERTPYMVDGQKTNTFKSIRGGNNQGTWVCKELVYAYAMWVSAKFHLAVIRAFDVLISKQVGLTEKLTNLCRELNTVDSGLTSAGRYLCVAGKQVKPRLIQQINATANEMQPSLDFGGDDHAS